MDKATGGDSSSTGMLAMISEVLGEIFTVNARSSFGSCVDIHSVIPFRASSTISGEIYTQLDIIALTYAILRTYVFFSPDFHRPFSALLGVNPPALGHVCQVSQAQEVQMDEEPLDFLLLRFRLV